MRILLIALALGGCVRNGDALIASNASARPACFIPTPYGGKFVDMEDPQCSRSSRSRLALR